MNQNITKRLTLIVAILALAIIAFEIFNYDTTRFALANLLGNTAFYKMRWSTILAVAFCGIDLAGLVQLFSVPVAGKYKENQATYFLFGAWLLGASLNAVMTWYAVGITLLDLPIGNEILSRQQLVRGVPLLIAVLVWLTRILFVGALTVMGDEFLQMQQVKQRAETKLVPQRQRVRLRESKRREPSRALQRAEADVEAVAQVGRKRMPVG